MEASYAGDSNYGSAVSAIDAIPAGLAPLVITPAPGNYSSPLTVTISEPIPGATIYYSAAGTVSTGGFVAYTGPVTLTQAGAESILAYATESGYEDANYESAAYTIGTYATPTVTVTPSSPMITNEQGLTVTITVAGVNGQATPTGSVTLAGGGYSAQSQLTRGAASFSIPAGALNSGADTLIATYSGDSIYSTTTAPMTVTVSQLLAVLPAPTTIAPGSSATSTATFTAGSSYSGTLKLACTLSSSPQGRKVFPRAA